MISMETKYNLHYGKVRGDILPPPHGTNTILVGRSGDVRYTAPLPHPTTALESYEL